MPKRVDANQPSITKLLREMGASVQPIHEIGHGAPDLLVGFRGSNYLFELKDPDKPPSARKLTEDEETWHLKWYGQVATVMTFYDIVEILKKKHPEEVQGVCPLCRRK